MRAVLGVAEMQAFDSGLIARGVPGIVLMENAGRGAAHILGQKERPRTEGRARPTSVRGSCVRCADGRSLEGTEYLILCGPGNNGGDGFVVARHLVGRGAKVRVLAVREVSSLQGDARIAAEAWLAVGGTLEPASSQAISEFTGSVIVDALLGTGVRGPVDESLADLIEAINAHPASVVALDVPSGFDADRGCVHEGPRGFVAVRAEQTITFGFIKRGLLTTFGHEYSGRITLANLGVPALPPEDRPPVAYLIEEKDLRAWLSPRPVTLHKWQAGEVLIIGGSPGMVGAAHLCARAALRSGAGLAVIHTCAEGARALEQEVLEVMTRPYDPSQVGHLDLGKARAVVFGPGLGRGPQAEEISRLAHRALADDPRRVVVDADGLRLSVGRLHKLRLLRESGVPLILTPHSGEAAALLDTTAAKVEADRFGAAQTLADRSHAVVVLKGSRTIIAAPDRPPLVNALGSPCMATAGSGDVLAGILGALLAERPAGEVLSVQATQELAALGVGLHGLAGEMFEQELSDSGCLASDLADRIPLVRRRLLGLPEAAQISEPPPSEERGTAALEK